VATAVLGLVFAVLIFLGAQRMQRLESWGLALTGTILALLPCSCCCIVGMPVGIWSLVVLLDEKVKGQFR
jgi:hypothetical protein